MEIWKLLAVYPSLFCFKFNARPITYWRWTTPAVMASKRLSSQGWEESAPFLAWIALAASGPAVVLYTSETLFFMIKLFGAMYLLWLRFNLWRSKKPALLLVLSANKNWFGLVKQEFALAAGNPKAILLSLHSSLNLSMFLPTFIVPILF